MDWLPQLDDDVAIVDGKSRQKGGRSHNMDGFKSFDLFLAGAIGDQDSAKGQTLNLTSCPLNHSPLR